MNIENRPLTNTELESGLINSSSSVANKDSIKNEEMTDFIPFNSLSPSAIREKVAKSKSQALSDPEYHGDPNYYVSDELSKDFDKAIRAKTPQGKEPYVLTRVVNEDGKMYGEITEGTIFDVDKFIESAKDTLEQLSPEINKTIGISPKQDFLIQVCKIARRPINDITGRSRMDFEHLANVIKDLFAETTLNKAVRLLANDKLIDHPFLSGAVIDKAMVENDKFNYLKTAPAGESSVVKVENNRIEKPLDLSIESSNEENKYDSISKIVKEQTSTSQDGDIFSELELESNERNEESEDSFEDFLP